MNTPKSILRVIGFISALFWFVPVVDALTLYSYQDDAGNLIVVDDLEKVPAAKRASAYQQKIRTYSSSQKPATPANTETGSEAPVVETLPETPTFESGPPAQDLPPGTLVVEQFDEQVGSDTAAPAAPPELASLTIWLSQLKALQSNVEEMWHVGKAGYTQHPRIRIIQVLSLKILDDVKVFESIVWDKAGDWLSRARVLTDQFRTLFWSLSRWILEKPPTWVDRLPPLSIRTRFNLETLERELTKIEAAVASETRRSSGTRGSQPSSSNNR